jgi:hypothetical protein
MVKNDISAYLSLVNQQHNDFICLIEAAFGDQIEEIYLPSREDHGVTIIMKKEYVGLEKVRKEVLRLLVKFPHVKISAIRKKSS